MKKAHISGMAGLGLIGTLVLSGCETDPVGSKSELPIAAYTASQCATASPIKTFTGEYSWPVASGYGSGCNAIDETSGGSSLYLPYGSYVAESALPTTQAACEAVTIRSTFYKKSGSSWVLAKDESHTGVWGPIPINRIGCSLEATSFPPPGGGIGVRVATTVRRPSGSSFVTLPFTTSFSRQPR